jgi:hypothetical protein
MAKLIGQLLERGVSIRNESKTINGEWYWRYRWTDYGPFIFEDSAIESAWAFINLRETQKQHLLELQARRAAE